MDDNITRLRVVDDPISNTTMPEGRQPRSAPTLTLVPALSPTDLRSTSSMEHPSHGGGTARPGQANTGLTRAERGIADLVSTGASNGEIARSLGISRHTVESHLKHIYVKLQIVSRVQLAIWFIRHDQ